MMRARHSWRCSRKTCRQRIWHGEEWGGGEMHFPVRISVAFLCRRLDDGWARREWSTVADPLEDDQFSDEWPDWWWARQSGGRDHRVLRVEHDLDALDHHEFRLHCHLQWHAEREKEICLSVRWRLERSDSMLIDVRLLFSLIFDIFLLLIVEIFIHLLRQSFAIELPLFSPNLERRRTFSPSNSLPFLLSWSMAFSSDFFEDVFFDLYLLINWLSLDHWHFHRIEEHIFPFLIGPYLRLIVSGQMTNIDRMNNSLIKKTMADHGEIFSSSTWLLFSWKDLLLPRFHRSQTMFNSFPSASIRIKISDDEVISLWEERLRENSEPRLEDLLLDLIRFDDLKSENEVRRRHFLCHFSLSLLLHQQRKEFDCFSLSRLIPRRKELFHTSCATNTTIPW